jgi:hypothetical protein
MEKYRKRQTFLVDFGMEKDWKRREKDRRFWLVFRCLLTEFQRPLVVQTVHLRATAVVVVGTFSTRRGCFLFVLFVAATVRIAVRVTAVILALVLARAELHKVDSRTTRLAEAGGGGVLPHEGLAQLDLANDVVDLGVTTLVFVVRLRPRTIQCSERHFSNALEMDGGRQFRFRKPRPRILTSAVVLLEVDVDGDTVVAFSIHRFPHDTLFRPFIHETGVESINVEPDGILGDRRRRARTELGFRLLHLRLGGSLLNVHRPEGRARFGEAGRAANGGGHD